MRKPVDAPLGDGTAEHAARGVDPAQDYECGIGTPVRAPFAASRIVRWGNDDALGGYALTGYAPNGDYWVLQHLSKYLNGSTASEGETVALSGNSGRWTTGPHLHHYVVLNGIRHNPEDIGLYDHPETAGGDARPLTPKGPFMALSDKQQDDIYLRVEAIANVVGDLARGVAVLIKRGGLDQQQENDIYMRVEAIANTVGRIENKTP